MYKLLALIVVGALFYYYGEKLQYDQTLQYIVAFVAFTAVVIIFVLGNKNNRA